MRFLRIGHAIKRQDAKTQRRHGRLEGCMPVTWASRPCADRPHGLKARVTGIISRTANLFSFRPLASSFASLRLGDLAFVRPSEPEK